MLTMSFKSLRGSLGRLLTLALSSAALCGTASAQIPSVISNSAAMVPHNEVYGNPWQTSVTNRGDFVLFDFKTTGTYQYPANGGPEITIAAPGVIAGGFTDSGIAIDPRNNDMYLNNNYNTGLLRFPFDTKTGTYDLPSMVVADQLTGNVGGSNGNAFQGVGMSMNARGILAVGTENSQGVEIFTVPVDASGKFGAAVPIVSNMTGRAKTVAIDNAGNIYFTEDGGLSGVLYIPAGTTGLANDKAVARIDPMLGNVQGVTVDASGNVYIVDGSAGAYQIPLVNGVPVTSSALLLSTVPANGGPSIDSMRGILFYPTSGSGNIKDLVKIYLNRTEFGSLAVGKPSTPTPIVFNFLADAAPYTINLIQGAGAFSVGDLSNCGITFTQTTDPKGVVTTTENPPTGIKANNTCSVPVTFTPSTVGRATATLQMLDQKGNVLTTVLLHGVGTGSSALVLPTTESAIGAALKAPSQIAADAAGTLYIADSGQTSILTFAQGSGATTTPGKLGTGLTAPTGVAVDPIGNVYIADSGKVVKIPNTPTGLNTAATAQLTLKTGLGKNLKLAADAIGDLYIADPDNQRYIQLRTVGDLMTEIDVAGYAMLSAIATDGAGDVFLANGQNLVEISTQGQQTIAAIANSTNGLATDHSGAVYVTSATQTVRIPNVGGVINGTTQTVIAPAATKPASVAVDSFGNVYVADASALNVDFLAPNGSLNLGKQQTTTSTSTAVATILNNGNAPLTITGFGSTADYSVTSNTCVGTPVAAGANCSATVTFNPGPGDQGTLTGQLAVLGNETYSPVAINVTGVGSTLANSTTTETVNKPTVTATTAVVTVTPATGTTPVPTGNVTLTISGSPLVQPLVFTQPLVNGTATFNLTTVPAGNLSFSAKYIGDRVYGVSTATNAITVAKGVLTLVQPPAATVPVYVLSKGQGSQEPYDSSEKPYYYIYPVTVVTANGAPLVGIPVFDSSNPPKQTGVNYGAVAYNISAGTPVCAGNSGTVPVASDFTAGFPTQCLDINTSNTQIVNNMTSYTVTPTYSGANYGTVTGTPVTFIAIRNPMVTIASNPGTLTVAAGSAATTKLTVTSLLGYGVTGVNGQSNNYSLPVELGCDGLPAHATCSFTYPTPDPSDPNSTAVTPTAPGTAMMTVNTNVSVGTTKASLERQSLERKSQIVAALLGFGVLGMAFGRRKTYKATLLTLLPLFFLSAVALGLSACSSADISVAPVLTTPSGTYQVTVTAKQTGSKQIPNQTPGGAPQTIYGNGNQVSIPFTVSVTIQ